MKCAECGESKDIHALKGCGVFVEPETESHAALIARLAPGYEECARESAEQVGHETHKKALWKYGRDSYWAVGSCGINVNVDEVIWLRRIQSVPTRGPLPAGRYRPTKRQRSTTVTVREDGKIHWDTWTHGRFISPGDENVVSWGELHRVYSPFTRLDDEPEKVRCDAMFIANPGDRAVQCDKNAGHEGGHRGSDCTWGDPLPEPTKVDDRIRVVIRIPRDSVHVVNLSPGNPEFYAYNEPAKAQEAKACWECIGEPFGESTDLCWSHSQAAKRFMDKAIEASLPADMKAKTPKIAPELIDELRKKDCQGEGYTPRMLDDLMATENDEYARRQAKHIEQIRREMAQGSSGILTGYRGVVCGGLGK